MMDVTTMNAQELVDTLKASTIMFEAVTKDGKITENATIALNNLKKAEDELLKRLGWWDNKKES